MEHDPWLLVGLSSAVASAATWGMCRWWFGRQLAAAAERIDKLDKARLFVGQQVMQARRQIEKLQLDAAASPKRSAGSAVSPPSRAVQLEAVLRSVDHLPALTKRPATGFADTQAMEEAS